MDDIMHHHLMKGTETIRIGEHISSTAGYISLRISAAVCLLHDSNSYYGVFAVAYIICHTVNCEFVNFMSLFTASSAFVFFIFLLYPSERHLHFSSNPFTIGLLCFFQTVIMKKNLLLIDLFH